MSDREQRLEVNAGDATIAIDPATRMVVVRAGRWARFLSFDEAVLLSVRRLHTPWGTAAARTLTLRLVERFGERLSTPFPDLCRLFPDAATLAAARAEDLGKLGIVRQRVRALQALAAAVAEGRITLHRGAPLTATMAALRALPGIGEWTTELIAMRALAWPDAFPASDIGVLNALGTRDVRQVKALAEAWRPWRSYAVMGLWQTLEK